MLKKFFSKISKKEEKNKSLSDFFVNSSSEEKAKIFKKAGHSANKDQKALVDEYHKTFGDMCEC